MIIVVPVPTACSATPPAETVPGDRSVPADSVIVTGLVCVADEVVRSAAAVLLEVNVIVSVCPAATFS